MNIFICALVLILCSPCVLSENENVVQVRLKREPPVYRPVTIYRSFYGPPRQIYGPPKLDYGPPKSVYGPPKSYYGPSKPIYGPPRIIYGPPPKPIYNFPISNYAPYHRRPSPNYYVPPLSTHYGIPSIYGPPTSSYDVSAYPSSGINSYLSRPSQNYASDLPLLPPAQNYGPPSHVYPNYNTQPSSGDYDDAYAPPQSIYTNYGPPSQEPHHPRGGPSAYESPHSSYEVPITQSPPALQYDTSSASYGTPGALTSYGTPIGNHDLKNLQKRINASPYLQEPFTSFEGGDTYSSSSNIAQVGEPFKISPANRNCKHQKNIARGNNENSASNHNYDGPGVVDVVEAQRVKKIRIKKNPVASNHLEEGEYFNECNN